MDLFFDERLFMDETILQVVVESGYMEISFCLKQIKEYSAASVKQCGDISIKP